MIKIAIFFSLVGIGLLVGSSIVEIILRKKNTKEEE